MPLMSGSFAGATFCSLDSATTAWTCSQAKAIALLMMAASWDSMPDTSRTNGGAMISQWRDGMWTMTVGIKRVTVAAVLLLQSSR